jgi:hypothetical protein
MPLVQHDPLGLLLRVEVAVDRLRHKPVTATRDEVLHWNARDTEERRRLDEWRFERQPEAGNEVPTEAGAL